jgi:hypothetical protein
LVTTLLQQEQFERASGDLSQDARAKLQAQVTKLLEVQHATQRQLKQLGLPLCQNILQQLTREQSLAKKVANLHLKLGAKLSRFFQEDFLDMFEKGDVINGNTRQILVPEPGTEPQDVRLDYSTYQSLSKARCSGVHACTYCCLS